MAEPLPFLLKIMPSFADSTTSSFRQVKLQIPRKGVPEEGILREAVPPRRIRTGHLRSFEVLVRPDLHEQARKLQRRPEATASRRASRCVSKARGKAKAKAKAKEGRENSTKEAVFLA